MSQVLVLVLVLASLVLVLVLVGLVLVIACPVLVNITGSNPSDIHVSHSWRQERQPAKFLNREKFHFIYSVTFERSSASECMPDVERPRVTDAVVRCRVQVLYMSFNLVKDWTEFTKLVCGVIVCCYVNMLNHCNLLFASAFVIHY